MNTMKALVVEDVRKLTYKDVPVPEISDNEVLVKVHACGICGSDIPRARDGGVHSFPSIIGHEFSGEIVQIGSQAGNFVTRQRVTAAPLVPCGHCANCSTGQPAMCTHYSFIGSRQPGAMAEYAAVPAANIIPIADNVTYEQAACIEPITVAIHGIERARIMRSGKSAIVYGCGTIGLLTLQCLLAKGIERIYIIDIDDAKLALAKKLGACETLNSLKIDIPAYFAGHGKVDYAFETAGVNILQAQLPDLVKKRGSIVYIGTAPRDVTFPAKTFEQILRGELSVTGSWMSYSAPFPGDEWIGAAEYLRLGKVRVDELITHRFPLSAGYQAFETLLDKNQQAIKVMYTME